MYTRIDAWRDTYNYEHQYYLVMCNSTRHDSAGRDDGSVNTN